MLGYNMFAYCENNPVNQCDFTGEASVSILEWWYTFGTISSATPIVMDDLVWIAGILLLGGTISGIFEETPYYNPILDFEYNQQFIYDESTPIVQDTIEYKNDSSNTVLAKKENGGKYDPNPYRRPGEKKQNRENRIKSRQKGNWEPRNNKRDGKPAKPKPHSPSKKGHRKDFNTIIPIDLY